MISTANLFLDALFVIIMYLHEFHLSSFIVFNVDLCLSLRLQIMNLFLQRRLRELSLVPLPPTLPQVLLPVRQLK